MGYSAIIVLGNLMSKEGELNRESSARMDLAISTFYETQTPYIVTCGWAYRSDSSIAIADAMKRYAVDIRQVTPSAIFTEENSRDTVGDAVFTKKNIVTEKGWDNILVVTSDYHVSRTRKIFNFIYGNQYSVEVKGADTDNANEQSESEENSTQAFYETFEGVGAGDDASIYERLCERHPFYNGVVYPKM